MKIMFPTINIPRINYIKSYNVQQTLKPLAFDTFERTSFKGSKDTDALTSEFEIKNIKNLRCPVCGLIMLTDKQMDDFIDDIQYKRGFELVETFEKYEDDSVFTGIEQNPKKSIFRPQKQEIINIIKELAKQYPDKTLSELTVIETQRRIQKLIKTQLKIVEEIEEYVKKCHISKAEKAEIATIIDEFKKEIQGESAIQFQRKSFLYALSGVSSNTKIQNAITDIAQKLPTSEQNINAWFVKYSRASSREIAKSFVKQSIPTAEHLQPRSKSGSNGTNNYICDCADCNSKRGNVDFDKWMDTIPNFKENLQQYLQDVQDALDKGTISSRYFNYTDDVIETIKQLSKHKIILDEPKSNNDAKKMKTIFKRTQQIKEAENNIEKEMRVRAQKRKEIRKLKKHNYYENIILIENCKKELEDINERLSIIHDREKIVKLQSRKLHIQNQINVSQHYVDELDNTDAKIDALQSSISSMVSIEKKFSRLKVELDEEEILRQKQSAILEEISNLNSKNNLLLENLTTEFPEYDTPDTSFYNQYLHYEDLLDVAENLYRRYGLSNKKSANEKEVAMIAIEALKTKMDAMLKDDSVLFFYNKNKIKELERLLPTIDVQLDKIEEKKDLLNEYSEQIQQIGHGKTLEEMQQELEGLKKTKENVQKIKQLYKLKEELDNLDDTISFNTKILNELKNGYTTMPNEDFQHKLSLIY